MTIHIKPAQPDHQPTVSALLEAVQLPINDLPTGLPGFVIALDDERLVGSAGVEYYGHIGLLRSVAVHPDYRNYKLGRRLVDAALQAALEQGVNEAYLITTTADQYFDKYGFERVERSQVPAAVAATQQFSQLCPSTAVVMKKSLR